MSFGKLIARKYPISSCSSDLLFGAPCHFEIGVFDGLFKMADLLPPTCPARLLNALVSSVLKSLNPSMSIVNFFHGY